MSDLKVGARVEIVGKGLKGSIAFIGATQFASGKWVGVTLDDALGKNSGEVQGKRYFQCAPNHGVFVRPPGVQLIEQPAARRKSTLDEPTGRESRMKSPARTSRLNQPRTSRQSIATSKPAGRKSMAPPQPKQEVEKVEEPPPPPVEEVVEEVVETDKMIAVVPPQPQQEQPPPPTTSNYTSLAPGLSMIEVETLKAQAKDWKEKYETIRLKRQEDRGKLKETEKMRLQIEQLTDGKNRSSKQIQELSKQLREAKKAMDEAIEAKERYMDENHDHHEQLEMAVLDKEMAEEKLDTLTTENENLKDKVDELQTDIEIMKAEIDEEGGESVATNKKIKQLEEQIVKFRTVVINLKDLSAAEKGQALVLQKQLDEKAKEMEQVKAKCEKLAAKLHEAEELQDELKEQVDAAMAAELMVVNLTDKNLDLEAQIDDLTEQVQDLETMNDMNEELQENARESELELREEVDLMKAKLLAAERLTQAAQDNANDHIETIGKFRALVKELQDSNQELRALQDVTNEKGEGNTDQQQQQTAPPPAYNYHIKMVETKTTARMVDSELSKLEVQQAKEEVRLVSMFIPAIFNRRGGDNDCVQTLLMIHRMFEKCEILVNHISQKYGLNETHEKGENMLGVDGEQLTFASNLVYDLTTFKHLLQQYYEVLNKCEVDLFQKMGTLYSEMLPHDRMLNVFFNHIKKDTLDETINTQNLTKSIEYFKHVYQVHLHMVDLDCSDKMRSHCDKMEMLLLSVILNNTRLRSFIQGGQETSDVAILLKDISTLGGDIQLLNKKAKRKIPTSHTSLKFDESVDKKLNFNIEHLADMERLLRSWVVASSQVNTESITLPTHKLSELLRKTSKEIYKDQAPLETIRLELGNIVANLNGIVTSLQEGEFDFKTPKSATELVRPVEKRSIQLKAELTDCEDLMGKISERDVIVMDLKKTIKNKNGDIQEAQLRSAMFERKLTKALDERNERVTYLQQKLDSLTEDKKKKEKEFDETLDAMQNDIDQLESEKLELKERIQAQAKRSVFADLGMRATGGSPSASGGRPTAQRQLSTTSTSSCDGIDVRDSPLLKEQIECLQVALRKKCKENQRLLGEKMCRELDSLPSLDISSLVMDKSAEMKQVLSQAKKLEMEALKFSIPKVVDITKAKTGSMSPMEQMKNRKIEEQKLKSKIDDLLIKAQRVKSQESNNSHIQTHMTTFPSKSFIQQNRQKTSEKLVGKLHLSQNVGISSNKLVLNQQQFHHLNQLLMCH